MKPLKDKLAELSPERRALVMARTDELIAEETGRKQPHKETITARVKSDPEYANALFEQGIQAMLDGDVDVGKSIIRDALGITLTDNDFDKFIQDCWTGSDPNEYLRNALNLAKERGFVANDE